MSEDLKAKLARLEAENAALQAKVDRTARKAGWFPKPVKATNKNGEIRKNPPRYVADRILDDGTLLQFCIGKNGRLGIGGGWGTSGVSLWDDSAAVDAVEAYFTSGQFRKDFNSLPRGGEGLETGMKK